MEDSLNARRLLLEHFGMHPSGKDFWERVPIRDRKLLGSAKRHSDFLEMRLASGPSDRPLYIFYSKQAVGSFLGRAAAIARAIGVTQKNMILDLLPFGSALSGSMYCRACNKAGVGVMAVGTPNITRPELAIELIDRLRPDVWFSMPSYALRLLAAADAKGSDCVPKKIMISDEILSDAELDELKKFGAELYETYGPAECPAISTSERNRDPRIQTVVGTGAYVESVETARGNELLVTDLNNTSTPVIRYRTGNLATDIRYGKDGSVKEFTLCQNDRSES
ncbi:AMP-binding enzyme [uncultured archaeon]|nr:AMP-binding enzyme [uncultured archaeon]